MKFIRKKISFISLFMATIMLLIAVPHQPLLAAMIPTEATIDQIKAQDARDHLKALISRNEIKKSLMFKGIDLHGSLVVEYDKIFRLEIGDRFVMGVHHIDLDELQRDADLVCQFLSRGIIKDRKEQ